MSVLAVAAMPAFSQDAPVTLEQAWATDTILKTPESVLYDQQRDVIYVANINQIHKDSTDKDGFISRLKPDGTVDKLKWISGLNDPKGMAIYKNTLYVSDLTELLEIDIAKGKVVKRHKPEGAIFLNDVATDTQTGEVLISDSYSNKVYKLKNGISLLWLKEDIADKPNGLLIEQEHVVLATMGGEGKVHKVKKNGAKEKEATLFTADIKSTDGIASDGKGNYFISNWAGEIYYVNAKGDKWKILDTKEQKVNSADIDYSLKYNLLLVPTFFNNRVVAYKVK